MGEVWICSNVRKRVRKVIADYDKLAHFWINCGELGIVLKVCGVPVAAVELLEAVSPLRQEGNWVVVRPLVRSDLSMEEALINNCAPVKAK